MLCLSRFELYSRWVLLFYENSKPLYREKTVYINLGLSEVALLLDHV